MSTSTDRQVVFNGRFLSATPTGVHRVAAELIGALSRGAASPLRILAPKGAPEGRAPRGSDVDRVGFLSGQAWEQASLPFVTGGATLVSLCNLAPAVAPGIVMIHDAQVHITPKSYSHAFSTWYRTLQPIIGRRARRVLTVSEYSRQSLVEYGVAKFENISVVPNGVDHMTHVEPDDALIARHGLRDRPFVIALANVQEHKNIRVLFAAFRSKALCEVRLVLFGSASAEDFLSMGLDPPPNTIFLGRVTDAQYAGLAREATCLAFPSTTEGFGLPPLEAMRLGCPAVVAPCGALPEVCGDAADYADPHSPSDWAAAIERFLDRDYRTARGTEGMARAASYTWARSANLFRRELTALGLDV